jgi:hypothetical protein
MRRLFWSFFCWGSAPAQSPSDLMNDPPVRAAMEPARRNEPQTLDLQVHVCEIPAPPFDSGAAL